MLIFNPCREVILVVVFKFLCSHGDVFIEKTVQIFGHIYKDKYRKHHLSFSLHAQEMRISGVFCTVGQCEISSIHHFLCAGNV